MIREVGRHGMQAGRQHGRQVGRQTSKQTGMEGRQAREAGIGRQPGGQARDSGRQAWEAGLQAGMGSSITGRQASDRMNVTLFVVTTLKDKGAVDGVRKTTPSG
jgi:hypothetical protein